MGCRGSEGLWKRGGGLEFSWGQGAGYREWDSRDQWRFQEWRGPGVVRPEGGGARGWGLSGSGQDQGVVAVSGVVEVWMWCEWSLKK